MTEPANRPSPAPSQVNGDNPGTSTGTTATIRPNSSQHVPLPSVQTREEERIENSSELSNEVTPAEIPVGGDALIMNPSLQEEFDRQRRERATPALQGPPNTPRRNPDPSDTTMFLMHGQLEEYNDEESTRINEGQSNTRTQQSNAALNTGDSLTQPRGERGRGPRAYDGVGNPNTHLRHVLYGVSGYAQKTRNYG